MKNEPAFIPDSISAISGVSFHFHPASRAEPNEGNSDATEILFEEIIKPRGEKGGN
jgi:hypothetical protein